MIVVDGVEMLDVREAAALAHRTPETVRRWVWTGRLRAERTGNRLLLFRADVLELVASRASVTDEPQRRRPSLAEWARRVQSQLPDGPRASTARDLILQDRAARDADAGR